MSSNNFALHVLKHDLTSPRIRSATKLHLFQDSLDAKLKYTHSSGTLYAVCWNAYCPAPTITTHL